MVDFTKSRVRISATGGKEQGRVNFKGQCAKEGTNTLDL